MKTGFVGALLARPWIAALAIAGCASITPDEASSSHQDEMTPLDRLIVGRAAAYPANEKLRDALPELLASQGARRAEAWNIARKVLLPEAPSPLPRFQTWYAKEEILPMFDRILQRQTPEERANRVAPTAEAIDEAFRWEAERAKTLPNWSEERLARRKAELEADGPASLGGPERVLMSPAMVAHIYKNYASALRCIGNVPKSGDAPPSETNFAPCVGEEFPADAVVVKARWTPNTLPLEAFDTSGGALSTALAAGEWGEAPRTAIADDRSIYSMRLSSGIRMRLVALHVASKELRDWAWVSLFWSDAPAIDFGADRPVDFTGPFGNYKMCTVVDFDEADRTKREGSLGLALAAVSGERSWCSNPYLEHGKGYAVTICIGCHLHGGTDLTSTSILEGDAAFPDGSRERLRSNFPADYSFITSTGLELAALLKAKADQLSPPR